MSTIDRIVKAHDELAARLAEGLEEDVEDVLTALAVLEVGYMRALAEEKKHERRLADVAEQKGEPDAGVE